MLFLLLSALVLAVKPTELVTCTSVVKLQNLQVGVRLHSHEVKYGSGSGQQSVTGVPNGDDANSYWTIHAPLNKQCKRGEPIECGSQIRLHHHTTGKYLHSHTFGAPMANGQLEVSAFGDDGKSDSGDNWQVVCSTGHWNRMSPIRLKHVVTGKYLTVSGNTFGRPIAGQYEITAHSTMTDSSLWKPAEAIMFHDAADKSNDHDEL